MRSGIRGGLGDYAAQAYAELDQQSELIRETRTCLPQVRQRPLQRPAHLTLTAG
jgi:hypothetical protein